MLDFSLIKPNDITSFNHGGRGCRINLFVILGDRDITKFKNPWPIASKVRDLSSLGPSDHHDAFLV
jgi:hypothetical protein